MKSRFLFVFFLGNIFIAITLLIIIVRSNILECMQYSLELNVRHFNIQKIQNIIIYSFKIKPFHY